jgi:outer membrane protein OmpU
MKKILLGTTAIVAAGMIMSAPAAFASEKIKIGVGGYMEQWFGYVSNDDGVDQNYSGFDVKSDSEINFKGSTKLDNGISIGVNVQLEANTGGDMIDETYMIVSGDFGTINIGDENSAMYSMHYSVPEFGIGMNSGDQTGWLSAIKDAEGDALSEGGAYRAPFGTTHVEPLAANDSTKVTYYTPRVEGIQFGVSYSPDTKEDSNGFTNRDAVSSDLVMASVNLSRQMGGAKIEASFGYGSVLDKPTADADGASALNAGIRVSVGGFGVAASHANFDNSGKATGSGSHVGVNYTSGPMGVSLGYFHGEKDGTGSGTTLKDQGEQDTIQLSAKYAVGPGVGAHVSLANATFSSDDAALDNKVNEVTATYLVVGMRLSF